jgi:hypothetical protein
MKERAENGIFLERSAHWKPSIDAEFGQEDLEKE